VLRQIVPVPNKMLRPSSSAASPAAAGGVDLFPASTSNRSTAHATGAPCSSDGQQGHPKGFQKEAYSSVSAPQRAVPGRMARFGRGMRWLMVRGIQAVVVLELAAFAAERLRLGRYGLRRERWGLTSSDGSMCSGSDTDEEMAAEGDDTSSRCGGQRHLRHRSPRPADK
jgi:hypothetical protein